LPRHNAGLATTIHGRLAAMQDSDAVNTPRRIARMIRHIREVHLEALDKDLAPFDVSAAQFAILAVLASGETMSASGLCRTISYDPGAMTRMVDRLEKKGLIQRVACPADRRTLYLELTAKGEALYPRLQDCAASVWDRFQRGFTKDEVRQLEGFLQRMLANG
jgi:DNA-binding MarR family transcriptional regulator